MPTAPSDLVRRALGAVLLLVVTCALTGCSIGGADEPDDAPTSSAPTYDAPPDVAAGVEQALRRRSRAVIDADPDVFDRGVGGGRAFREQQRTWFANLRQLPVGRLDYVADPAAIVRDGDDYWVVVEEHLQLAGYDAVPVVTRDRYRFTPSRRDPARLLLSSVTDADWERANEVRAQPWDLGPVEIRSGAGVLGVFDAASVHASDRLLRSVERGIGSVSAVVPYDWSRSVVVYALSDPAYLAGIDDVPGGDPDDLDGVAFPVPTAPGDEALAPIRFALHPRMLDRPGPARDRLVRHELTHVALGPRDDRAPVWLSEGLAEWVSVQPMAAADRRVPDAAVRAAEAGFTALPEDEGFNDAADDAETETRYALAWWACEYLARSFGESVPWTLLDQVGAGDADVSRLLHDQLGIWPDGLARRAGELIVVEYGAKPEPPPEPPTTAPASPTADPSSLRAPAAAGRSRR